MKFKLNGITYRINSIEEKWVRATKLDENGKGKKGRPAKLPRADVETALGYTLEVTMPKVATPTVETPTEVTNETPETPATTDLPYTPVEDTVVSGQNLGVVDMVLSAFN